MVKVVDVAENFGLINEHWLPHVVGNVNECAVKLAKLHGEFTWHSHQHEDELFFVIKGQLVIELRDGNIELGPNQMAVIPRGTEHRPVAANEVWVMLFEPNSTLNTGDAESSELTQHDLPTL